MASSTVDSQQVSHEPSDSSTSPSVRADTFSKLLWPENPRRTDREIAQAHQSLRRLILVNPYDEVEASQFRATTWKILLGALDCKAEYYFDLATRRRTPWWGKIKNDTFRTLATDSSFRSQVSDDMLVRLLEAFVSRSAEESQKTDGSKAKYDFTYVQGMNVLAAPFLYIMPSEVEAFMAFSRFIEFHCPLYVQPTLEGVHSGLRLLDICLQILDPELFQYLKSKNLRAEIYAFPSVLTFCACTEPLDQVSQLWDYLFAFGVGLNVLCVISQLYMMRDKLLAHPSPMALLRKFPALDAKQVIMLTNVFIRDLPTELYEKLIRHPFEKVD